VENTTTVLANSAGFYRIFGTASTRAGSPTFAGSASFSMSDGSTSKIIWGYRIATGADTTQLISYDFNVFLPAGHSVSATSATAETDLIGSIRQLATVTGTTTVPSGFVSE